MPTVVVVEDVALNAESMVPIATNRTPSDKNSVKLIDTSYMHTYKSAIVHMHIVLTRVTWCKAVGNASVCNYACTGHTHQLSAVSFANVQMCCTTCCSPLIECQRLGNRN